MGVGEERGGRGEGERRIEERGRKRVFGDIYVHAVASHYNFAFA